MYSNISVLSILCRLDWIVTSHLWNALQAGGGRLEMTELQ